MGSSLTVRNFSWQDFETLHLLVEAGSGNDASHTGIAMRRNFFRKSLEQPGCNPERDCFISYLKGLAIGYLLVTPEYPLGRAVVRCGVHPDYRGEGVGRRFVDLAIDHARALGLRYVHIATTPQEMDSHKLLRSKHFSLVRVEWHMRWELATLMDLQLPSGHTVRHLQIGEEQLLTNTQNDIFAGNWGFSPNTVDQIASRVRLPGSSPEDVLLLAHGVDVVGYCWTRVEGTQPHTTGIIYMTGVSPKHRGEGLGRIIVRAGMHYLVQNGARAIELTVDQENTPAERLYTSLGFKKQQETQWYERYL